MYHASTRPVHSISLNGPQVTPKAYHGGVRTGPRAGLPTTSRQGGTAAAKRSPIAASAVAPRDDETGRVILHGPLHSCRQSPLAAPLGLFAIAESLVRAYPRNPDGDSLESLSSEFWDRL